MADEQQREATGAWARFERASARAVPGLLLLAIGVTGVHRMFESDVFWHLHQGRAVLRHGARVIPEPTAIPELVATTPVAAWLWDALVWLVYDHTGYGGLSVLTSACALLAALAVLWMLRATRPSAPIAAYVFVSSVALTCLLSRARTRPEVAAMIMLPLLVGALRSFTRALWDDWIGLRSRPLWIAASLAVLSALLWAQLHGSFLLVLPIAASFLVPALVDARRDTPRRSALLALGCALLLASLSSTSGLDLFAYASEHAATDIKLHNTEMHPPMWGTFNPLRSTFGPLFPLSLALALFAVAGVREPGSTGRRRVLGPLAAEIGLTLTALAIATQSVRFLATATVLTAPLALHGASRLLAAVVTVRARAAVLALSCALGLFVFQRGFERTRLAVGPFGETGLAEHIQPMAAAGYLRRVPRGTRVLSAYDAGGILGLLLDGHARTYVDSRTMVLFDAVQFAVARDTFRSRAVLERVSRRYRADVIVMPRSSPLCAELSAPWQPVAVDPMWTTWSRRPDARVLSAIAPCGRSWLTPAACADDSRAVREELAYLRTLHRSPLQRLIEATALHRCAHDADAAQRALPDRAQSEGFAVARDVLAAELDLALGGGRRAVALLGAWAAEGDLSAWDVLQRASAAGGVKATELLPIARQVLVKFDDRAPPALRELLAMLCSEVGDAACVHFHGLRAALEGSPNADALLSWLSSQHPDSKVRADAAAFRAALASERGAQPEAAAVPLASSPALPAPEADADEP
jgi:hypothetical protein